MKAPRKWAFSFCVDLTSTNITITNWPSQASVRSYFASRETHRRRRQQWSRCGAAFPCFASLRQHLYRTDQVRLTDVCDINLLGHVRRDELRPFVRINKGQKVKMGLGFAKKWSGMDARSYITIVAVAQHGAEVSNRCSGVFALQLLTPLGRGIL